MARKHGLHIPGGLCDAILRGNPCHDIFFTTLAHTFGRDLSTLSHACSHIEERSRKSPPFAKALRRHLYAISQA
jgi:hypothetical protein